MSKHRSEDAVLPFGDEPMTAAKMPAILDLFAGPGGWDEGLRLLGRSDVVGIEHDLAACQTAVAAGHRRILADVAQHPMEDFAGSEGLIASPPCPDWSVAGTGLGRDGKSGGLVDEVPRWIEAAQPRWVACEQVPPALVVWQEIARMLKWWGYSTWTGVLNAADYGVPQTRRRAFLLASLDHEVRPPSPTHSKVATLDGLPLWVPMAQAIGWGITDEPAGTLLANSGRQGGSSPLDGGSGAREKYRRAKREGRWIDRDPAEANSERCSIAITVEEALILQGFRSDYPVQGATAKVKQSQIGNAVPPPLATHALAAAIGAPVGREAAA